MYLYSLGLKREPPVIKAPPKPSCLGMNNPKNVHFLQVPLHIFEKMWFQETCDGVKWIVMEYNATDRSFSKHCFLNTLFHKLTHMCCCGACSQYVHWRCVTFFILAITHISQCSWLSFDKGLLEKEEPVMDLVLPDLSFYWETGCNNPAIANMSKVHCLCSLPRRIPVLHAGTITVLDKTERSRKVTPCPLFRNSAGNIRPQV